MKPSRTSLETRTRPGCLTGLIEKGPWAIGVHRSVRLGLRVNSWLNPILSGVGVCHPPFFDNHRVSDRRLTSGLRMGSVGLVVSFRSTTTHKKTPNHSAKHNIKSHHSHRHNHVTILILPMANFCIHSTRKLQKWWARVSDSRKVWDWWVVFYFKENDGEGT